MNDLFQNFSFIFTADNYKNLPASHDRSDSHGICLFWNILFAVKESFVGLNRGFSQIYAVSLVFKMVGWFIKTNMSIVTKPEDLDISWTDLVVVSGKDKAEILKQVIQGPVTPEVPGSILQFHPDCTIIADEDALSAMDF